VVHATGNHRIGILPLRSKAQLKTSELAASSFLVPPLETATFLGEPVAKKLYTRIDDVQTQRLPFCRNAARQFRYN
jgi:hypothetical protein